MAHGQAPQRVRAYGATTSPPDEGRSQGRRAIAISALAGVLVGLAMLAGGSGLGGERYNVLSMERGELGSPAAMKARMGILMGRFSMLEETNGTAANGTSSNETASGSNGTEPQPTNETEYVATPGPTPAPPPTPKCSGDPMETYQSFSCWLSQYKDPEDVEVSVRESDQKCCTADRSHTKNHRILPLSPRRISAS